MSGSLCAISRETCRRGDGGRSQRPNSTDAGVLVRGGGSKTTLREVGQEERERNGGFK